MNELYNRYTYMESRSMKVVEVDENHCEFPEMNRTKQNYNDQI